MPGSFGLSRDQLEQQVRDQKNVENLKRDQQAVSDSREADQEKARIQEIDSKLPTNVISDVHGKLTYAEFKARYQPVWDQIATKEYLTQRIRYTTKLGAASIVIRSLTKREQKALTFFEPSTSGNPEDQSKFRDQQMEYSVLRLVVQLESLGTLNFPDLKLTPETRDAWRSDSSIKQQYEYLMDMDPMYISHLLGLVNDLDQAKYFALIENLKNP